MNKREEAGGGEAKHRYGFRAAIHRRTPFHAEKKQNCRNQCPGVCNTDPEDKGCNIEIPSDGIILPRHSDAGHDLMQPRARPPRNSQSQDPDEHVIPLLGPVQRLGQIEICFGI